MKQIKPLVLLIICTSLFFAANAGNGNNNNGNHYGQNKGHKGGRVPIDGGITLLLAAGIGYGAKKISDKHKKKNPVV